MTLANLLGLITGFALLAEPFPCRAVCRTCCPRYLPDDWKGGFVLLVTRVRAVERFWTISPRR